MTVQIEIHQTRTTLEGPTYRVETNVIYALGIDRNIFVFDRDTQVFSHVASVWDIENYPANYQEALTADLDYYRAAECSKDYTTAPEALEFAVYTRGRVQSLVNEYEVVTEDFEGEGDYTFTNV